MHSAVARSRRNAKIDTMNTTTAVKEKHQTKPKRGKRPSTVASATKHKNRKIPSTSRGRYDDDDDYDDDYVDVDSGDDDDDDNRSTSSSSTASTFSYIQSILQRRRRHIPPSYYLSTVEEHIGNTDTDEEDGTTNGVFHPISSTYKRAEKSSSRSSKSNSKRKRGGRRKKSSSSSSPCCKLHPILLLAIIGVVSNWMANRILSSLFLDELESENDNNDYDVVNHGRRELNVHNSENENEGEGEGGSLLFDNLWGDTFMGGEDNTNSIPIITTDSDQGHNEQLQEMNGIHVLDNGYHRGLNAAEQYDDQRLLDHYSPSERYNMDFMGDLEAAKRFADLRERLLSLYSEKVPPQTPQPTNNSSLSLHQDEQQQHPLFNTQSPQYKALTWLANIDKLKLTHDDPGLVQRYVLVVMYFSTGGPMVTGETDLSQKHSGAWRNPTNFLAPVHECEWKSRIIDGAGRGGGIRRCDKNKTVVEISIYNELQGTIPSELGRLWNLRTLYLGRNHITGTIPTELGMIQKLSSLSLQWNDLTGTIPEQHLKNLLTLRALQLEGNEKMRGNLDTHSLVCQMRNKYRGPTPRDQERYTGSRVLRTLTATCIPSGTRVGVSDRLECACCTECFGKSTKDSMY